MASRKPVALAVAGALSMSAQAFRPTATLNAQSLCPAVAIRTRVRGLPLATSAAMPAHRGLAPLSLCKALAALPALLLRHGAGGAGHHLPATLRRCRGSTTSATATTAGTGPPRLPVGIFIDLDNVQPACHGREDARAFVEPLRAFGNAAGTLSTIAAFANSATLRWVYPEERKRRATMLEEAEWDAALCHTGRDSEGVLRCGVCSARMALTKKDRARGLTPEHKLRKHMTLHSREHSKRLVKSQHKTLRVKEREKVRSFRAAQVGVRGSAGGRNDLFTVLREEGISCSHADDVDTALARAAMQWIRRVPCSSPSAADGAARGCIVVVSEDADFVPLLAAARERRVLAVSATLRSEQQTIKLCQASDLVLVLSPTDEHEHLAKLGELLVSAQTATGHEFLRWLSQSESARSGQIWRVPE